MTDILNFMPDYSHPLTLTYDEFLKELLAGSIQNDPAHLTLVSDKLLIEKPDPLFDTYLQGLSEVMMYLCCSKQGLSYIPDMKLRSAETTSVDKRKDVDLQICVDSYTYNIEIKTPEQDVLPQNSLIGEYLHRSSQSICEVDALMKEVTGYLEEGISNSGKDLSVNRRKTQDNKAKEFLSSAQAKFSDISSSNSMNILMLCIPMRRMSAYWHYLFNCDTGLLTKNSFNKDVEIFDKTDLVLLSSIPTCHIKLYDGVNPWNMENIANVFCLNPIGKRIDFFNSGQSAKIKSKLSEIIPTINEDWDSAISFWVANDCGHKENSFPLPHFEAVLNKHFPLVWNK